MARTRSIKPEFWSDEKLAQISLQARLLYIGLWTTCDDAGRTKAHPIWLRSQIFPYDSFPEKQIEAWLKELIDLNRIVPYTINGERYFTVPKFHEHQKIQHPSPARNPDPPPDSIEKAHEEYGEIHEESGEAHEQTETETETETETILKCRVEPRQIIEYLNQKLGTRFKNGNSATQKLIHARIKEGFTLENFHYVIDLKYEQWNDDPKMKGFLRPQTLFGTKFESYLQETRSGSSMDKWMEKMKEKEQ